MGDLLAQFRRPGSVPAVPIEPDAVEEPPKAPGGYRAFSVCSGAVKPARLEIRPKDGLAIVRPYASLTEIAYDRTKYNGMILMFGTKMVKLEGRNLQPIIEALIAGTCEVLSELEDAQEAGAGMPVIDKIVLRNEAAKPAAPAPKAKEG